MNLSDMELQSLRRIGRGQPPSGEAGEAAALESLLRKGLVVRRQEQALPLESRRSRLVLTADGRAMLRG